MSNENYWLTSFDTTFPLDKNSKKSYNGINTVQKNVFDNAFANSALDYLYSNDNLGKTQSFLENNGFPSIEERQYNKQSYGAADENRQMLDLFQSKSNSILNPKLSDDTDRAFLSGLMGEEEEKAYHQSQIADANNAIKQWQSAFSGSPLENQLNGAADSAMQKINTVQNTKSNFFNAKNEVRPVTILDPNTGYDIAQYSNNNKIKENAKMNNKSVWNVRRASNIIEKNANSIKIAANKYGVNPAIIAACIYSEQMLNYNVTDLVRDKMYWDNPSVGIGQVTIETAQTIERNTNIDKIKYLGKKQDWHGNNYVEKDAWYIPGYGTFFGTKEQAISKRLNDDEQCVEYVAAYLKLIQDLWREKYPIIDGKTDILATLYNVGEYGSKGINSDPKPNPFGIFAKKNYHYMRYLLGLE